MSDYLADSYPRLANRLPRLSLAKLPTPVDRAKLILGTSCHEIAIKRDDLTGKLYGGNKVRKLEYLLHKAARKNARCVATFGTVASNHALATALYARELGYDALCFLSHQTKTRNAAQALNLHLQNDTEIVQFGGGRRNRVATLREHLRQRRVFLIPPGGSNWLGAVGFVNAGLELASQIAAGEIDEPVRLYVANGTMATAVGVALGLALARLKTEVHAIQVTEDFVSSPDSMHRLLSKTASVLHRLDPSIPPDLAAHANYQFRTGFLGDGYAKTNDATDAAIAVARDELGITLDATYTGKAMAALLHDLGTQTLGGSVLFWNTYNSRPLPVSGERPIDTGNLPDAFLCYFD
jgi:1-aminocyclopropane-1-carboxylate deaminase/D-cysteine desulfhydrase-like pyridoxal-dependent ACC family enzyme